MATAGARAAGAAATEEAPAAGARTLHPVWEGEGVESRVAAAAMATEVAIEEGAGVGYMAAVARVAEWRAVSREGTKEVSSEVASEGLVAVQEGSTEGKRVATEAATASEGLAPQTSGTRGWSPRPTRP